MVVVKFKKIFYAVGLLSLASATLVFCVKNPSAVIKLHKSFYVKYARITKSDFENRFTHEQLLAAIKHAKSEIWVQQQIESDLHPYKNGISSTQIDKWFKELQHPGNKLAKFTINNGEVTVIAPPDILELRSYKTINSVVSILANKKLIPDCQFIVALNDYLAYVPENYTSQAAILSFAKHTQAPIEQDTILIPDWMNLRYWDILRNRIKLANKLYSWDRKKKLIHWRGGCADSMGHRTKLVNLSKSLDFLDVGMTEGPNPASYVDPELSVQYKYQISLDGARCTWERMIWQMYSNTILIKPTSPQVQWFHRGLKPYFNYVPIADVTDNEISFAYNWLINNDESAKIIVSNANQFAKQNFKTEDFFAYYAILISEYSKLINK